MGFAVLLAGVLAVGAGAPLSSRLERLQAGVAEDDTCSSSGASCGLHALQVSKRRQQPDIQVIGAGHPRTGSQSVMRAFEILGYTSTSGADFQFVPAVRQKWMDWAEGGSFDAPLNQLMEQGVQATTADWPASCAWKELMERFPKAKVILFTHPRGAEGWLHSFESAARYYSCDGVFRPGMFTDWLNFGVRFFHGAVANVTADLPIPFTDDLRTKLLEAYELDNAEIRRTVPADRLLEYTVTEGWEPLCDFLGKPVPDVPFPNIDTVGGANLCQDVANVVTNLPQFMHEAGSLEKLPEVIKQANEESKAKPSA